VAILALLPHHHHLHHPIHLPPHTPLSLSHSHLSHQPTVWVVPEGQLPVDDDVVLLHPVKALRMIAMMTSTILGRNGALTKMEEETITGGILRSISLMRLK
jgi:hypothetical protein